MILSLLCACLLGVPSASGDDDVVAPAAAIVAKPHPLATGRGMELNRALRAARRRDCDAEAIVASLVAAGPGVVAPAITAMEEGWLPAAEELEAQIVSELQESLMLRAIGRFERAEVWNAVELALVVPKDTQPSLSLRRAALLAAGTVAQAGELRALSRLALADAEDQLDARLELAFQQSVARVIERRPEGLTTLAGSWRNFRPELLPALLLGAGSTGDARAVPLLSETLEQGGDFESISLSELARQRAPADVPEDLLRTLRERLDPERGTRCQAAATALCRLGDFSSVDELVRLLDSPVPGIRATVHRGLCHLTGLQLPPQANAWNVWRQRESKWFDSRQAELARRIETGTETAARAALSEVSLYRWERHRLSEIVAVALEREEPALRVAACNVLVQLASPRAIEPLRQAAASEVETVALAARSALQALEAVNAR